MNMMNEFERFTLDRYLAFLLWGLRAYCLKPPHRIAYIRQEPDANIFVAGHGDVLPVSGDRVAAPAPLCGEETPSFYRTKTDEYGFDTWVSVVTDNISPTGEQIRERGLIAIEFRNPRPKHVFTPQFPLLFIRQWFSDSLSAKRMADHFQRQAVIDELTGLPNLRETTNRLLATIKEAIENHEKATLVLIDMDFFKSINDTYTHAGGDVILKGFADHSRQHGIFMGRIGGEEFFLIFSEGLEAVRTRLRHFRESWAATSWFNGKLHPTISGGVCEVSNETIPTIVQWSRTARIVPLEKTAMQALRRRVSRGQQLLPEDYPLILSLSKQWADHCLYRAKGRGRNIICDEPHT